MSLQNAIIKISQIIPMLQYCVRTNFHHPFVVMCCEHPSLIQKKIYSSIRSYHKKNTEIAYLKKQPVTA